MGLRIAIDTGGTFTDVVAIDEDDRRHHRDQDAVHARRSERRPGRGRAQRCWRRSAPSPVDVHMLLHGSTVATNAVLEHKFDGLGLLVTKGFRHLIEIARQSVPDGYGNSFFWVKPRRLVPLHLVREVPGRMRFDGSELEPLDEAAVIDAVQRTRRRRCALHRRLPAALLCQRRAREARRRADRQALSRHVRLAVVGRAAGISRVRAGDDDADRCAGEALLPHLPAARRRQDHARPPATFRS